MPLTKAQEVAIHNHDDNLIVIAGAGSGKTYVLVQRYLQLLDRNPDWALNALVAITFTQKAAQEMRDRVRQHLQRQADEAADPAAAERWTNRLAAMDSARIDTIHGLCATILRTNAAAANVDPAFTVLDEIEARILLDTAIDDVLRTLDPGDPVLALFTEYGEREIRAMLRTLAALDLPDGDLFAYWCEQWELDARAQIDAFRVALNEITSFDPLGSDALSNAWGFCRSVIDEFAFYDQADDWSPALDAIRQIAGMRMPGKPAGVWGDLGDEAKAELRRLHDLAIEKRDAIGEPPGDLDRRAALLLPLWATLIARVRDQYRRAKTDRAALDFDDLEALTRDLLQADAVRDRLSAEFRHVLVDEFQDTNAAQWAIIRRLADPAVPGCLFVVGDPKQSIYGFRGADVSVFERVRGEVARLGQAVDLDRSFRSHRPLIDCFNQLFERLLVREPASAVSDYQVEYGDGMSAERATAPGDAPLIEFVLIDKQRVKTAELGEDQAARRVEARDLARRLKQIIEVEQRPIYDKQRQIVRPIDYGDVALLLQALTNVTLYEEAFKAEGIPYLTIAGKGYFDRQEVWDLLNLLRALYNPADDLALAAALRSPLFSLSDDALLRLRRLHDDSGTLISLWDALDRADQVPGEAELIAFARDTLRDLRAGAGRVTIAELLRSALDATGYLAVLTGLPDGARRRGNVEKLLDKAETSGRVTLSAFVQYLKDMSDYEAREGEALLESAGAVQIMSVHKSKGLEFPLVVLGDASHQRGGGAVDPVMATACRVYDEAEAKFVSPFAYRRADNLAQQREDAERRRLLYVAATRAQDYLIVSGQVTCKADTPIKSTGWLGWLLDAFGLTEIDDAEAQTIPFAWGDLLIRIPAINADLLDAPDDVFAAWSDLPPAEPPALLRPIPANIDAPTRILTATQIADLGGALYAEADTRSLYAERWRRSVYHDAPGRIDAAQPTPGAKLGEIVHRAIQWELPANDDDLRDLLQRYTWEEGITDPVVMREVVKDAYMLVRRVRRSDVFRWINQAQAVFREQPFVLRRGERLIHGVIDLLLRDASGHWRVIDYKTGTVRGYLRSESGTLPVHARRYHLQVGVYAAAVQELTGETPAVYIHYLRYAATVPIATADWSAALDRFETEIAELLDG